MKKYLLMMAAALTVAGANAQNLPAVKVNANSDLKKSTSAEVAVSQKMDAMNLSEFRHNSKTVAPESATTRVKGMRKSVANGVYYNRPAGTMYQHFSSEGMGFYPTILRFPAYVDVPFVDESANTLESEWYLNTYSLAESVDENGVMQWMQNPLAEGYLYPCVTLQNGKVSYQLSENGRNWKNYPTRMCSTTEITPLGFNDDHAAEASYYGWSGMNEKHYLFGTGEYTDEETKERFILYGVSTEFEKPITPLYVESIDAPCFSFTLGKPIPEGKVLTLTIYNTETEEVIATMTCDSEGFVYGDDNGEPAKYDTDYGDLYDAYLHFAVKGEDAFGTEVEEPVVLDCAFTVVIEGFDQEGVDVGFGAYKNYEPDVTEPSHNLEYNVETGEAGAWGYQTPFNIGLTFNALFDTVLNYGDVEATDGNEYPTYYVEIEADGTSSHNAIFGDLEGAMVLVGTPWFTEEGDEMYGAELPEWIQGMTATEYAPAGEGDIVSQWVINFTADELPADVTGRGAFIFIEGRGVTMEEPIFVFQGDPDAGWEDAMNAAGIEFVTKNPMTVNNGKLYNVAGQVVNGNFKGIVIKDGKKFMNK